MFGLLVGEGELEVLYLHGSWIWTFFTVERVYFSYQVIMGIIAVLDMLCCCCEGWRRKLKNSESTTAIVQSPLKSPARSPARHHHKRSASTPSERSFHFLVTNPVGRTELRHVQPGKLHFIINSFIIHWDKLVQYVSFSHRFDACLSLTYCCWQYCSFCMKLCFVQYFADKSTMDNWVCTTSFSIRLYRLPVMLLWKPMADVSNITLVFIKEGIVDGCFQIKALWYNMKAPIIYKESCV